MQKSTSEIYQERLARYVTAMKNEKPDKIPIRPFVAEFTAKYTGMTCQQVTHDFNKAFIAAQKCAKDFDWDAVVGNMVYVWTGLTQAIGLKYYATPGIEISPDTAFQYLEPKEENAFMKADEYDLLIKNPTDFLYNVWLPRVSTEIKAADEKTSFRNNLAFVKGGMAMMQYFNAFGPQGETLKNDIGVVSAISGILKAPFDILADKLRGYIGLTMDMMNQPNKVLKACEALMPHIYHIAQSSADPNHQVPVGYWMHRGGLPFVSKGQFESHYWPTIKPIIEELWRNGNQTLFYAEGSWDHHLDSFAELPLSSIVYHIDRGDYLLTHKKLGHKFCLSGGVPNAILALGSPQDVQDYCKNIIDTIARDGGYIMDASAIMQNDTKVENIKALTNFTREYGVYSDGHIDPSTPQYVKPDENVPYDKNYGMPEHKNTLTRPGVCIPWQEKQKELPQISGDADIVKTIWENTDDLGHMFIWQCLLSF